MESSERNWKLWTLVIGLNFIAVSGAYYLKSIGVNLYAFRGGS